MDKKICFTGDKKDVKLAEKLCVLCCEDIDIQKNVYVAVGSGVALADDADAVAVEFGAGICSNAETYTYSVGQSNADICGFNFQKRELSRSLELLSGSFMGRVNIPVDSEFTEESVIYCAAGLLAAGIPMAEVLRLINAKVS